MWLAHVVAKTLALTQTAALVRNRLVGEKVRVWGSDLRSVKWVKLQTALGCSLNN